MGAGYYKEVTTWDNGVYYNTNNGGAECELRPWPERSGRDHDDQWIRLRDGRSWRHVGQRHRTVRDRTANEISGFGVIQQNTDLDVFSFDVGDRQPVADRCRRWPPPEPGYLGRHLRLRAGRWSPQSNSLS